MLQQGGMAMEGELANGLIVGHAYSVTDARTVRIGLRDIFILDEVCNLFCTNCKNQKISM